MKEDNRNDNQYYRFTCFFFCGSTVVNKINFLNGKKINEISYDIKLDPLVLQHSLRNGKEKVNNYQVTISSTLLALSLAPNLDL